MTINLFFYSLQKSVLYFFLHIVTLFVDQINVEIAKIQLTNAFDTIV